MGRTVVRATVVSFAALVLLPVPGVGVRLARAASANPGICTAVVHSWAGRATVGPGESFHTGTMVPAQTGVQLAVEASDVSTDVPAPGALSLWIGDTRVADGAAVVGGEIAVTNIGSDVVVVTRVEISVDECVQVEVAPPLPPVLGVPSARVDLPATGTLPSTPLAVAVLATCVGAALMLLRRRPAATGSGRGR
jgi:hypothetical protein